MTREKHKEERCQICHGRFAKNLFWEDDWKHANPPQNIFMNWQTALLAILHMIWYAETGCQLPLNVSVETPAPKNTRAIFEALSSMTHDCCIDWWSYIPQQDAGHFLIVGKPKSWGKLFSSPFFSWGIGWFSWWIPKVQSLECIDRKPWLSCIRSTCTMIWGPTVSMAPRRSWIDWQTMTDHDDAITISWATSLKRLNNLVFLWQNKMVSGACNSSICDLWATSSTWAHPDVSLHAK